MPNLSLDLIDLNLKKLIASYALKISLEEVDWHPELTRLILQPERDHGRRVQTLAHIKSRIEVS